MYIFQTDDKTFSLHCIKIVILFQYLALPWNCLRLNIIYVHLNSNNIINSASYETIRFSQPADFTRVSKIVKISPGRILAFFVVTKLKRQSHAASTTKTKFSTH